MDKCTFCVLTSDFMLGLDTLAVFVLSGSSLLVGDTPPIPSSDPPSPPLPFPLCFLFA